MSFFFLLTPNSKLYKIRFGLHVIIDKMSVVGGWVVAAVARVFILFILLFFFLSFCYSVVVIAGNETSEQREMKHLPLRGAVVKLAVLLPLLRSVKRSRLNCGGK